MLNVCKALDFSERNHVKQDKTKKEQHSFYHLFFIKMQKSIQGSTLKSKLNLN